MALSRLGNYIELVEGKNSNGQFGLSNIKGISTKKEFIPTKANMDGISLSGYKIVNSMCFAYVADTSRRGDRISLAFNETDEVILVSSITTVFRIKSEVKLLPYYLYMFFNRPEFDRYTRFNSWGSAREAFSWEDMCDIELDIPPIEVQQKVVDVYLAMVANQKAYERGLDDLKLVCEAYIEDLKKHTSLVELNVFIEEVTAQNSDATYKIDDVMGVSKNKEIIPTKANASENDLTKFIVIEKNDFVYNPRSANAIAINSKLPGCIISWNNTAFRVKKDYSTVILSKYLNLWFSGAEYSRWAKYNSWGSSTELLSLDEIKKYHIPLPNIKIQEAIVKVFENYESRKFINDKLKTLIKIEIADEQKQFIAPKEKINKAILLENVIAFDIFKEDVLIGFVMLRKYAEGEYFLWDYAIDYHHQNKGYGIKALMELLTFLKAKFHIHTITTTYIYGNEHAKFIYEKVGFIETDIVNEDGVHEVNMILHL